MVHEEGMSKMAFSLLGKREGQQAKEKMLTKITCVGRGCSEMCLGVLLVLKPLMLIFKYSVLF